MTASMQGRSETRCRPDNLPGFIRGIGKFTRLYSSLQTAKNPEFILTNLVRERRRAVIRARAGG